MNIVPGVEGTPPLLVDLEDVATLGRVYTPSVESLVHHAQRLGIPLYAAWGRTFALEYTEDNTLAKLAAALPGGGKLPADRFVRSEPVGRCIDVADATRLIEATEAAYAEHDRAWTEFQEQKAARRRQHQQKLEDAQRREQEARQREAEEHIAAAAKAHTAKARAAQQEAEAIRRRIEGESWEEFTAKRNSERKAS